MRGLLRLDTIAENVSWMSEYDFGNHRVSAKMCDCGKFHRLIAS